MRIVSPCSPGTFTQPRDEFTFGTPGCDPGERLARLFVPSAFNDCQAREECSSQTQCLVEPQPSRGSTTCFPRRIHEAAALSRPLDVLLEAFVQEKCQADSWKSSLVSIYFITVVTVELAEVRMPDAGGDIGVSRYWKVNVPRRREKLARVRDHLPEAGEDDRNGLSQELALAFHRFKAQGRDDREIRAELGTTVTELSKVDGGGAPGNGRFLVPGGWDDDGRSRMMLILRPAVATLRGAKALLGLSWLLFLLWGLLLWRGNVLARRMSENELVVQLLRKLGIGVVLLDEDGLIMAANDQAEDILGMYLPRLNIWRLRIDEGFRQARHSSDPMVRVLELIHPTVVMAADKLEDMKGIAYSNIWQQRLHGRPAMFYAKLKKGPPDAVWVKVTAAPVVIKRRGKKELTTSLSALDPVRSTDLRNALDQLVQAPGAK